MVQHESLIFTDGKICDALPDNRNNAVIVDDRDLAEWGGIWYSFHAEFSLQVAMLCQRELIESQMEQSDTQSLMMQASGARRREDGYL